MSKSRRNRESRAAATKSARPQPHTPVAPAAGLSVRVRHATNADQLAQFEKWASMADARGPLTARKLIEMHTRGVLATALDFQARGGADERALRAGGPRQ
ncbi:hypothetical protein [Nocardia sp. NPDC004711]